MAKTLILSFDTNKLKTNYEIVNDVVKPQQTL